MATPLTARDKLRKLAGPLLLSGALGALLYVGGDTSQAIGLEAFRTTRLVLGFLLGMATILSLAACRRTWSVSPVGGRVELT
jgi:hypothetical protein